MGPLSKSALRLIMHCVTTNPMGWSKEPKNWPKTYRLHCTSPLKDWSWKNAILTECMNFSLFVKGKPAKLMNVDFMAESFLSVHSIYMGYSCSMAGLLDILKINVRCFCLTEYDRGRGISHIRNCNVLTGNGTGEGSRCSPSRGCLVICAGCVSVHWGMEAPARATHIHDSVLNEQRSVTLARCGDVHVHDVWWQRRPMGV